MSSVEEWRPILGYEGAYEISSRGRVRSLARVVRAGRVSRHIASRMLSISLDTDGYPTVGLNLTGVRKMIRVHWMVCGAWWGACPPGLECRHIDGDKLNLAPKNLAWGTQSENTFDRVRHGTHHQARKTHCPKGHPYDAENTSIHGGGRHCLTCDRVAWARYKASKRVAA